MSVFLQHVSHWINQKKIQEEVTDTEKDSRGSYRYRYTKDFATSFAAK